MSDGTRRIRKKEGGKKEKKKKLEGHFSERDALSGSHRYVKDVMTRIAHKEGILRKQRGIGKMCPKVFLAVNDMRLIFLSLIAWEVMP